MTESDGPCQDSGGWRSDSVLLGWMQDGAKRSMGFGTQEREASAEAPVYSDAEQHLVSIGSTGAGKGRGQILPTLLSYHGSIFCIDPNGENAAVASSYRKSIGQDVHVLDPFGVIADKTVQKARLDPLDCLLLPQVNLEAEAENLAELAFPHTRDPRHVFWDSLAKSLVAGLFVNASTTSVADSKGMTGAYGLLASDDFDYALALLLDRVDEKHPYAYRAFSQYLALGSSGHNSNVRADVLATVRSFLGFLASAPVQAAVKDFSFSLQDVITGKPMTVFLVIPLEYLESHAPILKLWLNALIRSLWLRREPPDLPSLFLLDEASALGGMRSLHQAVTTLRKFGTRVWMFYQSLSQIKEAYPVTWPTLLDNAALMTFGLRDFRAAHELADVMGVDAQTLLRMGSSQLALAQREGGVSILRRPDYLSDPVLSRRASPNPFYQQDRKVAGRGM